MERWYESRLSKCEPLFRLVGLLLSDSAPDQRIARACADSFVRKGTLRSRDVAHESQRAGDVRIRTSRLRLLSHHGLEWQTRLYGARQTGWQRLYRVRLSIDLHEPNRSG